MPVPTASATGQKRATDELIIMGANAAAAQTHITEATAAALQAGKATKRQQQDAAKALASIAWRPATSNVATSTATTAPITATFATTTADLAAPPAATKTTYITSETHPRINRAVFTSPVVTANNRVIMPGASAFTTNTTAYRPVGSRYAAAPKAGLLRASSLASSASSHTSMYGPDALRAEDRLLGGWLHVPHSLRMMRADLERLPRRQQQLVWFLGLFVLPIVLSLIAERVFIGPGHGSGHVHPLRDAIPTWGQAQAAATHATREFALTDWLWPHRAAARIYDYAFGGGRCTIGDRRCIATEYRWNPIMRLPGWIADAVHGTRVATDYVLDGIGGAANHVLWAFGLQRTPKPFTVRAEEKLYAAGRRVRGDASRVKEGVKEKVCDAAGCVADVMRGAAADVKETATDFRKEVKRAAESIGRDANELLHRLV